MFTTPFPRDEIHNGHDRGAKIVGIACGFFAASVVVAGLRLGLRFKHRLLSWDDACVVVALVWHCGRVHIIVEPPPLITRCRPFLSSRHCRLVWVRIFSACNVELTCLLIICKAKSWGYGSPVKTLSSHELSRAMFVRHTPVFTV